MITPTQLTRLEGQLDMLYDWLQKAEPNHLRRSLGPGKWNAQQVVAHLARIQALNIERVRRILQETDPELQRYVADADAEWPTWQNQSITELIARLQTGRSELHLMLSNLRPNEHSRTGSHPLLGTLTLAEWVEFFLVHEAHHLYQLSLLLLPGRSAQ